MKRNLIRHNTNLRSIRKLLSLGVSRTKNVLLAANAAGAVQHWHMTSGKCLHTYEDAGNQVYAVDYSPDGSQFCTGGRDCAIRIYDEATKAETHCMKGRNNRRIKDA